MKTYIIADMEHFKIFETPTVEANRPIDAARKYLESIGEGERQLKISASRTVRILVEPCVKQNGYIYRPARGRRTCFDVF